MACLVTYHAIILHWKYFWWYLLISKVAYLLTLNIWYFWYLVWGADHLQTLFSKILAHYGKRERDRFWELCSYPNSHNDFLWVGLRTTHGYSYSRLVLSWKWKSVLCQIHKGTNMSPQLLRGQVIYISLCFPPPVLLVKFGTYLQQVFLVPCVLPTPIFKLLDRNSTTY